MFIITWSNEAQAFKAHVRSVAKYFLLGLVTQYCESRYMYVCIYMYIFIYVLCIYVLNKNTPGVQKCKAKLEAPISSYSYIRVKSVISDGGQGLGCLLKYHIVINTYHLLPFLIS